jgi:antitoxin PrlF
MGILAVASSKSKILFSEVSASHETVLPPAVCKHLQIESGDRLRFTIDRNGVRLERGAPIPRNDPFATFFEWESDADDEAYANL